MIPNVHPIAIPTNKSLYIILPLNLVGKTGLEPVWVSPRDFLTTIAFATLLICGLDYTFIIAHLP